ncbi:MAG: hypothetical protein UY67_C0001G0063 [Candidatus Kaiserbacteria bacterium GW2011_GWA2_52_12]|uniref:Uncharacterized protein n=1 Tax=Candidatus Kaiserbacteria bacterium GW2011_GWA2_52_12 TaxID=1618671 RepID=A0A0G1X243_9BACT|nr:MAG: hypothetical protein UY67_C0001G0063 [Candidatus Kaiserbacteria bacterium GW2011_GWA2_52_12]
MPEVFVKELNATFYQLPEQWIQKLVDMPETAMGYQLVDIFLKDGTVIEGAWIGNCQYVVPGYGRESYPPFTDDDIADIKMNPAGIRHAGPKIQLNRSP